MNERDKSRLEDMLDNARKILQFANGQTRDTLDSDDMFAYAVTHALEIIGEAARNVSDEVQAQTTEIEWKSIMNMRHRIAHDYLNIDHDIVWNVIQNKIPELIYQLETILSHRSD
jgi:uncharacterized protein with HEPN domain